MGFLQGTNGCISIPCGWHNQHGACKFSEIFKTILSMMLFIKVSTVIIESIFTFSVMSLFWRWARALSICTWQTYVANPVLCRHLPIDLPVSDLLHKPIDYFLPLLSSLTSLFISSLPQGLSPIIYSLSPAVQMRCVIFCEESGNRSNYSISNANNIASWQWVLY